MTQSNAFIRYIAERVTSSQATPNTVLFYGIIPILFPYRSMQRTMNGASALSPTWKPGFLIAPRLNHLKTPQEQCMSSDGRARVPME